MAVEYIEGDIMPHRKEKKQMNTYIPVYLDEYVEEVCSEVGISKSDFIRLWLTYSHKYATTDDIKRLVGSMMMFGEDGLQKLFNPKEEVT